MAFPATLRSGVLIVEVDDPAVSGSWIAPCGLTDRSLKLTAATGETLIPDCDDPDLPAWITRDVKSNSAAIDGSGLLSPVAAEVWRHYYFTGGSFPARIRFNKTGALGGGSFTGNFILTALNIGGKQGERVSISVTMASDGPVVWTAAS